MADDTTQTRDDDQTIVGVPLLRPSDAGRKAYLVVLEGWEIGREIELGAGQWTFGRAAHATVRINMPSVSREHAQIICTNGSGDDCFLITDLDSSNGTSINDTSVTSARLRNGDKIRMGDVLFKFVLADEADARFYRDVHRLIHYDQLTGLLTLDAFRRRLDVELQRNDAVLSLAMTDLDGLKLVNDTYGHLAGSMVIREMGAMIRQCLRTQDCAALYGGDETIILFRDSTLADAQAVAEKIRQAIETFAFTHKGNSFHVSISQGLAEWPRHGKTAEELIGAADAALYRSKADGRNCIRCAP